MSEDKKTSRLTSKRPDRQLYVPKHRKEMTPKTIPKSSVVKPSGRETETSIRDLDIDRDVAKNENDLKENDDFHSKDGYPHRCDVVKNKKREERGSKCNRPAVKIEANDRISSTVLTSSNIPVRDLCVENKESFEFNTAICRPNPETNVENAIGQSGPDQTRLPEADEGNLHRNLQCKVYSLDEEKAVASSEDPVPYNEASKTEAGSESNENSGISFATQAGGEVRSFCRQLSDEILESALKTLQTRESIKESFRNISKDGIHLDDVSLVSFSLESNFKDSVSLADGKNLLNDVSAPNKKKDLSEDLSDFKHEGLGSEENEHVAVNCSIYNESQREKLEEKSITVSKSPIVVDKKGAIDGVAEKNCVQGDGKEVHKMRKQRGKATPSRRKMKIHKSPAAKKRTEDEAKVGLAEDSKTRDCTGVGEINNEDDWDVKWSETGDCLSEETKTELARLTGIENPVIINAEKPEIDYYSLQPELLVPDVSEFKHLVEIYDFSPDMKTTDISLGLQTAGLKDFDIKWVDDTHAIGIFSTSFQAQQAVKMSSIRLKVRPISEGTRATQLKARSFKEMLLPYKPRPETTASVARNLVASALGVRSNTTKEQRALERQKISAAKERKRTQQKIQRDAWGD